MFGYGVLKSMQIYNFNGQRNVIGPTVLKLRKERKMTQVQLAEQLQLHGVDISSVTVLRIEKSLRFVTDYEVAPLAFIFNVSVEDLYPENFFE